jgi:hypothetical protein
MSDQSKDEELIELRDRLIRSIQEEYAKRNVLLRIYNRKLKTVTLKCDRDGFAFGIDSQDEDIPLECKFRIDLMYDGEKWTHEIVCGDHNHDISDRRAMGKRCGTCGSAGHNARSCKKKQDPNSLLLAVKFGLPKSPERKMSARSYDYKYESALLKPNDEGGFISFVRMQTKCTNCGKSGHNSRSCDTNDLTPVIPIYMPTRVELDQMIRQKTLYQSQLKTPTPSEKFDSPPLKGCISADHLSSSSSAEPIVKISQLLNYEDSSQAENQFSFKRRECDNNINVVNDDIPLWSNSIKILKKQKIMQNHIITRQRCGVCGLPGHNSRKHIDRTYDLM